MWKQGESIWKVDVWTGNLGGMLRVSRLGIRKDRAQVELNLSKDVWDKKNGVKKSPGDNRNTRDNVSAQLSEAGDLVTQSSKDWGIEHLLHLSPFQQERSSGIQTSETTGKIWSKKCMPRWWKRIRLQILKEIIPSPRGLMGWVLRELVDVLKRQFMTSWNDHGNWERSLKNGGKKVLLLTSEKAERRAWNCREFSLTSKPGMVMLQLILRTISRQRSPTGVVNMDSPRRSHSLPMLWPSTINWLCY